MQPKHSKEGSQLHYHGHDHPVVAINTCGINKYKIHSNSTRYIKKLNVIACSENYKDLTFLNAKFLYAWAGIIKGGCVCLVKKGSSVQEMMFDIEEHLHRRLRGDTGCSLLFI